MVIAEMVNRLADLHAWGRDPTGTWWGLVVWSVYGQTKDGNKHFWCSAWMPASTVQPSRNPEEQRRYPEVARLELPADSAAWPAVRGRAGTNWHHYGAITSRPDHPAGITVLNG